MTSSGAMTLGATWGLQGESGIAIGIASRKPEPEVNSEDEAKVQWSVFVSQVCRCMHLHPKMGMGVRIDVHSKGLGRLHGRQVGRVVELRIKRW